MTFRWYGSNSDSVTLKQIKQIPGMTGIMGFLDYKAAGEVWNEDEIKNYIDEVHAAGLECEVIESVNVHEDIKLGLPTRDEYIANYCTTIRNLAKYGVKVIVYNFMPVFDWLRTDLARIIPEDGSNSLYFDEAELGDMGPLEIVKSTIENSNGFSLRGWEPARLAELEKLCFSEPWSEKSLTEEIDNPAACFLVAMQQDEVLGYGGMHTVLGEQRHFLLRWLRIGWERQQLESYGCF